MLLFKKAAVKRVGVTCNPFWKNALKITVDISQNPKPHAKDVADFRPTLHGEIYRFDKFTKLPV